MAKNTHCRKCGGKCAQCDKYGWKYAQFENIHNKYTQRKILVEDMHIVDKQAGRWLH